MRSPLIGAAGLLRTLAVVSVLISPAVRVAPAAGGAASMADAPGLAEPPPGRGGVEAAREARGGGGDATEAAYRRAWEDPASRREAAAGLRELVARGAVSPTVDSAGLEGARARLGPAFLLTETRNFVVLSDADQAWTRQRAAMLERSRHQYFRVMDRLEAPVYPHRYKLLCILFKDYEGYREFSRAEEGLWAAWVAGYYSPRNNRIVFYNDSTSPAYGEAAAALDGRLATVRERREQAVAARRDAQNSLAAALEASASELEGKVSRERMRLDRAAATASAAKTLHEAIHLLAFNTGLQSADREYPFWLSEGLASSFEAEDPDAGAFGPDHGSATRRQGFAKARAEGRLMGLERLVALTEVPAGGGGEEESEADLAGVMYNQSAALFAHLFRFQREALAGYFQALLAPRAQPLGPEGHRQLFVRTFGDPGMLERKLSRE